MRVLLLDLDTLRPDHLGCYGYGRDTSPNIDSIAKDGVRFEQYFCSDAPCLPSRSALMSGMFGIHNGAIGHGGTAAEQKPEGADREMRSCYGQHTFPYIFRKAGFRTVSVSPFAERHSSFWFYSGFQEMYNTGNEGMESAEEVTPTVLDWIERNGTTDNWFLHVNYWDPHTPYRAPKEFGNPFENQPLDTWMTEDILGMHRKDASPHGVRELNMYDDAIDPDFPRFPGEIKDLKDYKAFVDGYDCGIRYMDSHIGLIFDKLKQIGAWDDDLAIIITSDHGENLGELNSYGEHSTADYITCRIPMIIKWKDCIKGHIDHNLHYSLDLAPTMAELFGVEPWEKWDGVSFKDTIFEGKEHKRDYIVLSQCAHVCQRSVLFDHYLYIRTYHDGFHTYDKEMLFDIKNDPYEQYNIAKERPDICHEAAYYLLEWHDEMMSTVSNGVDPMRTVMLEGGPYHAKGFLKEYAQFLRKTEREAQAICLESKFDSKFYY